MNSSLSCFCNPITVSSNKKYKTEFSVNKLSLTAVSISSPSSVEHMFKLTGGLIFFCSCNISFLISSSHMLFSDFCIAQVAQQSLV